MNAEVRKQLVKYRVLPELGNSTLQTSIFPLENVPCHKTALVMNPFKAENVPFTDEFLKALILMLFRMSGRP